jgi:cellobiose-specific phosphotransferase system component IIA
MQKIGLEIGLDVGGLVSGAARGEGALRELNRMMAEAKKQGKDALYGELGYQHDMLEASLHQFEYDRKSLTNDPKIQEYNGLKAQGKDVSKYESDQSFMSMLRKRGDSEEKLINALNGVTEAIQKGDLEEIQNSVFGANQSFREFHKTVEKTALPGGKASEDALLKAVSAQQIVSAVTTGVNTYVSHLDRSGMIGRQGSGDIVGANIEQLRRDAS